MGAVVSSSNDGDYSGIVADITSPSKEDWLSSHAKACNVSSEEISSLWQQFQDLGCENGAISRVTLTANKDNMIYKMLEMMPKSKDNMLTFQTFCNMSRWMSDATIENRILAVFQCLNNGQPLDLKVLIELLSEIYSDESQEVIERSAKVFLHQVGDMLSHSIDEVQFVRWAMQLPSDTLQTIMEFECAPYETTADPSEGDRVPSTKDVMVVAGMACRKDWVLLANKLGFIQEDINLIQARIPKQEKQQIQEMLSTWIQRKDDKATMSVLKEALRSCSLDEIADSLAT